MLSVKVNTLSCGIWPGESQIGLDPGADPKSQHPGITSVVIVHIPSLWPKISGSNCVNDRCDTFVTIIIMTFFKNFQLFLIIKDNQDGDLVPE